MQEKRKPYKGKVAFVSGGSRGIGLAVADKLAQRGANIVFTYLRSRSDAAKAEEKLAVHHVRVLSLRANMGNEDQVTKVFEMVKSEFGALDFLIHNAATGDLKPVLGISTDEWQRTQDINVRALLQCAQLAAPLMRGRHGRIVAISSHGSSRCLPDYSAVGVAKAAMEALCRYLAVELASRGIGANAVMAGTTDTQSLRGIPRHEEMIHSAKFKTPAGRIGHPEDIAQIVAFLCSEESRWIVGQTIVADGGYSIVA
ncbi:MAG: hypothetical protein A2901_00940 [Elusimicrobia bacterium RIFCSPLOWO2_01_FULL_54_10]|nr:MAG: hypothetical protein A2901_00940 [Elusimicrobia bacterium RIFCSPLOWO2_01_FULL_54_10]